MILVKATSLFFMLSAVSLREENDCLWSPWDGWKKSLFKFDWPEATCQQTTDYKTKLGFKVSVLCAANKWTNYSHILRCRHCESHVHHKEAEIRYSLGRGQSSFALFVLRGGLMYTVHFITLLASSLALSGLIDQPNGSVESLEYSSIGFFTNHFLGRVASRWRAISRKGIQRRSSPVEHSESFPYSPYY